MKKYIIYHVSMWNLNNFLVKAIRTIEDVPITVKYIGKDDVAIFSRFDSDKISIFIKKHGFDTYEQASKERERAVKVFFSTELVKEDLRVIEFEI